MSFDLENFFAKIHDSIDETLNMFPEDKQEREFFLVHMSVFDNYKLLGLISQICYHLDIINITKIQVNITLNDILSERRIDKPLRTLFDCLKQFEMTISNENRAEYKKDIYDSIGKIRTFVESDYVDDLKGYNVDSLITTLKKHNDIRITLQKQSVELIASCLSILKSYIDNKDNDYGRFYALVHNKYSEYLTYKQIIEDIEDDTYNMLFCPFEGKAPILNNESQEPSSRDWGELLERVLKSYEDDTCYSVFIKCNNRKQFFSLENHYLLDSIYYNCNNEDDLHCFYNEFTKLNYIKQQIKESKEKEKANQSNSTYNMINNFYGDFKGVNAETISGGTFELNGDNNAVNVPRMPAQRYAEGFGHLLFEFLMKNMLIASDTEEDLLLYYLRMKSDLPANIHPIRWVGTKQNLRDTVQLLYAPMLENDKIKMADMEKLIPFCFEDKNGNKMTLAKNKEEESFTTDEIRNFFADQKRSIV